MRNRGYCFPLAITDFISRFLITCEASSSTSENLCCTVFDQAVKEYGLPDAIRSDNGVPFPVIRYGD